MGFEIVKETYAGNIKEITLGKGDNAITVGGETCYPFYQFEGTMPHKPIIAMEIWDCKPDDWAPAAISHFKDVCSDPAAWAKKCVDEFNAQAIVLQLKSIDPNGNNATADEAVYTVKKILTKIKVPLIIWGCANPAKDEEVLKKIAEECQGENLILGPVEDKNHKGIGASAMGYGHIVISSSPIDVNLAKQVNILLENLGMPMDRVIVDPTTGGLGYGMEYSYSVMERLTMAALTQGDDKLQFPLINNLGNEVWKCKEAKQTVEDAPSLGDPERRGILMEAIGAVTYLMAGSDILIMRHPESIRLVKSFIDLALNGGSAKDVAPIKKMLDDVDIDFSSMSPELDLTIKEEKKAAPVKKAAPKPPPKAAAKPAPKKESAPAPTPPKTETKPTPKAEPKIDLEAQKAAQEKAKAEAEEKAKAAAEEKAKAKADADKKTKEADAQKLAEQRAKRDAEQDEIRHKREQERQALDKKREKSGDKVSISKTASKVQKSALDKILDNLNQIYRRDL